MLAMLTEMKLVPHSHFGIPGTVLNHTLVYTITIAILLTVFFDLSRIASLGAIFYLLMDIAIHWGVLRHLRKDIGANIFVLGAAIGFDLLVLSAFLAVKASTDAVVLYAAAAAIFLIFAAERIFLRRNKEERVRD